MYVPRYDLSILIHLDLSKNMTSAADHVLEPILSSIHARIKGVKAASAHGIGPLVIEPPLLPPAGQLTTAGAEYNDETREAMVEGLGE
jgi:hypothetical protein